MGLIAIGLPWPTLFQSAAGSEPVADPVIISDHRADFTVAADGTLSAVETMRGDFPSDRHGIFRYWDVANQNSPRARQQPDITSILMDGETVPYDLS